MAPKKKGKSRGGGTAATSHDPTSELIDARRVEKPSKPTTRKSRATRQRSPSSTRQRSRSTIRQRSQSIELPKRTTRKTAKAKVKSTESLLNAATQNTSQRNTDRVTRSQSRQTSLAPSTQDLEAASDDGSSQYADAASTLSLIKEEDEDVQMTSIDSVAITATQSTQHAPAESFESVTTTATTVSTTQGPSTGVQTEGPDLATKNIEHQAEIERLRAQLKEYETQTSDIQAETQELRVQLKDHEVQNEESRVQNQQLRTDVTEYEAQIAQYQSEIQELRTLFQSENEELRTQLEDHEEQNTQLQHKYHSLHAQAEERQTENVLVKEENVQLHTRVKEYETQNGDYQAEIQQLREQVKEQEAQNADHHTENKRFRDQVEHESQSAIQAKEREAKNAHCKIENDKLRTHLETLEKQIALQKLTSVAGEVYNRKIEEHEDRERQLQDQIDSIDIWMKDRANQINVLQNQLSRQNTTIHDMKLKHKRDLTQHDVMLAQSKEAETKLQDEKLAENKQTRLDYQQQLKQHEEMLDKACNDAAHYKRLFEEATGEVIEDEPMTEEVPSTPPPQQQQQQQQQQQSGFLSSTINRISSYMPFASRRPESPVSAANFAPPAPSSVPAQQRKGLLADGNVPGARNMNTISHIRKRDALASPIRSRPVLDTPRRSVRRHKRELDAKKAAMEERTAQGQDTVRRAQDAALQLQQMSQEANLSAHEADHNAQQAQNTGAKRKRGTYCVYYEDPDWVGSSDEDEQDVSGLDGANATQNEEQGSSKRRKTLSGTGTATFASSQPQSSKKPYPPRPGSNDPGYMPSLPSPPTPSSLLPEPSKTQPVKKSYPPRPGSNDPGYMPSLASPPTPPTPHIPESPSPSPTLGPSGRPVRQPVGPSSRSTRSRLPSWAHSFAFYFNGFAADYSYNHPFFDTHYPSVRHWKENGRIDHPLREPGDTERYYRGHYLHKEKKIQREIYQWEKEQAALKTQQEAELKLQKEQAVLKAQQQQPETNAQEQLSSVDAATRAPLTGAVSSRAPTDAEALASDSPAPPAAERATDSAAALDRVRDQAERYKPKTPSRLRQASRLSSSPALPAPPPPPGTRLSDEALDPIVKEFQDKLKTVVTKFNANPKRFPERLPEGFDPYYFSQEWIMKDVPKEYLKPELR